MANKKVLILMIRNRMTEKIESALLRNDFQVMCTDDTEQAIQCLRVDQPDAILVDWDFVNGMMGEIARTIQENCQKTGFILLSKSRKCEERIIALRKGADDCIMQPPSIEELVEKVKALVRRIDLVEKSPTTLKVKDIEIDLNHHEVRKGNELLELTYTQFKILYLLASQRETIFSRNEILQKVWGENAYVTDRTVDVHVKRLREKLGDNGDSLKYIQTIHGLGYRFA